MIKKIFFFCFFIGILLPIGFSKNCGGEVECSCGDVVTSSYVMKGDLLCDENALLVRSNLNCDGHSIKGFGEGFGVSVSKMDKKTISNCVIENFENGLILGDVGTNDKSELNLVTNSFFKNNVVGILSGTYVSRNKILDNLFENNEKSIQVTGGSGTLIVNNTFFDSTIFMKNTGSQITCKDNFSNFYFGDYGPDCSCLQPQNNLYVNSDTTFCSGDYSLPSGIKIGNKVNLFCNNTSIYGENSGYGVLFEGSDYSTISGCSLSNYTNGIEFKHKYYFNGYSTIVDTAKNNRIYNMSIFDVDIGVKTFHTSSKGDSKAEYIENSSILARNYAIYNPTLGMINAKNNFYGTNDKELIKLLFRNLERVTFEPYTQKKIYYDLDFGDYTLNNNILSVEILSQNKLIDNLSFLVRAQKNGEIVYEEVLSTIFSYDLNKTVYLENDNYDSVYIQIDPNLEKISSHSKETQIKIDLDDYTYRLKFSSDVQLQLSNTVNNFLQKSLFTTDDIFNFDKTLEIRNAVVNFDIPYSFSIVSDDNSIIISGHTTEGILSGVVSFLKKRSYFEENTVNFISLSDSKIGLATYNFLQDGEISIWDNTFSKEFDSIIYSILEQEYFNTDTFEVPIILGGGVVNQYSIERRKPVFSKDYKEHVINSEYPIILSGGLWSTIDSFENIASRLSQLGYTTYTIEMNGAGSLECSNCYNYNYQDLQEHVLPSIIDYIKDLEQVEKIVYVGHSNGGRTFLDSISNNYISSDEIFGASLLGVPGSFDHLSLLGSLIQSRGQLALEEFSSQGITHITQGDMAHAFSKWGLINADDFLLDLIGLYMNLGDPTRISTHLFQEYFNWINSTDDLQPGGGVVLDNFQLISGNPIYLNENDVIVPVVDEESIFDLVQAENKIYLETNKLHFGMANDESIYFEILNFLRVMN